MSSLLRPLRLCITRPDKPAVLLAECARWPPRDGETRPDSLCAPRVSVPAQPVVAQPWSHRCYSRETVQRLMPVCDWCDRGGVRIRPGSPTTASQPSLQFTCSLHPHKPWGAQDAMAIWAGSKYSSRACFRLFAPASSPSSHNARRPSRRPEAPRRGSSGAGIFVSRFTGP